ncbi:ferritin-like domain-containing protein [Emticicia sp. BO119]|uniref:YciE/YciF ferroxidase family protein n=1 Tax=Emticicia sp. BO119 TaxID=2757768 RepID=UPI0015F094F4|nr:ferritin-like domain-containing protein [Emticicia sp. BO119]MBA4852765.1 ferritin-like domain-containing protein [Emticicia sp. BO119]
MKNYSKNFGSSDNAHQEGEDLRRLFLDGLRDLYWAEIRLTKSLPTMAQAATSKGLTRAFESHLSETEEHVNRIERIFKLVDETAQGKKCPAMIGLLEEADEITKSTKDGSLVRDCGLILAAQKVEHYEIASYGTLRTIAEILGYEEVADILQLTLNDEEDADSKLTQLAQSHINVAAAQE